MNMHNAANNEHGFEAFNPIHVSLREQQLNN